MQKVDNDMANCPICNNTTTSRWRPFCSKRCADIDLARWMSGKYAIPGGDADADEDGDEAHAAEQAQKIISDGQDNL